MKESTHLRILGILILVVCAFIDMLPFTSAAAILGIIVLLFRPKWFYRFITKVYEGISVNT